MNHKLTALLYLFVLGVAVSGCSSDVSKADSALADSALADSALADSTMDGTTTDGINASDSSHDVFVAGDTLVADDSRVSTDIGRPTASSYVIMDFNDGIVHDALWLGSKPLGTVAPYLEAKADSGLSTFSIAKGAGPDGSDALEVTAPTSAELLPGFWILNGKSLGGSVGNIKDTTGYLLPQGMHANRLEFRIRFQPGYQATRAALQPPSYPNHQNFNLGTYHFDPNRIDGVNDVKESDNWHFYFQVWLRHDLANGEWMTVVLNEVPQHQRSLSALPPANATRPAGNFWELLTRFYFNTVPYDSDPEIAYPVKMWIDDIRLTFVEEAAPLNVEFAVGTGHTVGVSGSTLHQEGFRVTNTSSSSVRAVFALATPSWLNPSVSEVGGGSLSNGDVVVFAASEVREFTLEMTAKSELVAGRTDYAGVVFSLEKQIQSDTQSRCRSLSDDRVERRWEPAVGPFDGTSMGDHIRIEQLD
ncbi:MAG: hypothetical protein JRH20_14645 [Deltaproteobacteria bacterium]|nr:hypothetical protein [Deltaproteobacteria bacterium]